jgi:hypothetical protein
MSDKYVVRVGGGRLGNVLYFLFAICTAMIGYHYNTHINSVSPLFFAIMDFFFAPFAWLKWLICQQVNLSLIKETFSFFLS